MNTLTTPWQNNQAISALQWIPLAKLVGMKEVPRSQGYTSLIIKTLLSNHGPLWCAGTWYGPGHVIVLTGVDGETIHLNDPDGGVKKTGLISWFNTKLFNNWPGCLLAKDPNAY